MTKITITKSVGGHKAGDTIDVTAGAASLLTNGGYAETTQANPKRKPKAPASPDDNTGGGDPEAAPSSTAG